jgi:foldase protein PrsA
MKKWRKSIAATVLFALSALFAGCSSSSNLLPSDVLILNDERVSVPYVVKIDDYEVQADEYRYYFMNLMRDMQGEDEDFEWTEEKADELKQRVLEYITLDRAVVVYAASQGISLSETDQKEVQSNIDSSIKEVGGKAMFAQALADAYMTKRLFRVKTEIELLEEKMREKVFANGGQYAFTKDEMLDIVNREYVCIRYLKLDKDTDGKTENKDRANELLQKIRNGENFGELVNEYGQDNSMRNNPDGTYFARGMVDLKIEEASYALDIGEISDVIEGAEGYFIIKRQPINEDYVKEHIDDIIYLYQAKLFSNELTAIVDAFEITYDDVYEDISAFSMK